MKRSMRLAAIAVGVLGLVATTAPQPAQARTVGAAAYVAEIVVGGTTGLGYPVLTLTTTPQALTGTPLQTIGHLFGGSHPSSNCLQLPQDFGEDPFCLTNSHWTYQNLRSLSVGSTACADLLANIAKPGKAPVHPPGCVFGSIATATLPNTVSGHCGLSSGQLTVLYTDGLGQDYLVDIHFKAFGSVVFISGHFDKLNSNQHGLVIGAADAIPPVGLSQSCVNKTARNFIVVGAAAFIPNPNLP